MTYECMYMTRECMTNDPIHTSGAQNLHLRSYLKYNDWSPGKYILNSCIVNVSFGLFWIVQIIWIQVKLIDNQLYKYSIHLVVLLLHALCNTKLSWEFNGNSVRNICTTTNQSFYFITKLETQCIVLRLQLTFAMLCFVLELFGKKIETSSQIIQCKLNSLLC